MKTMTVRWMTYPAGPLDRGFYIATVPNPGSFIPNMTTSAYGDTPEEAFKRLNRKLEQLGQTP